MLSEPHYLDEAKIDALRPPKQDSATAIGMIQLKMPNVLSAKVWDKAQEETQQRAGFQESLDLSWQSQSSYRERALKPIGILQ